MYGWRARLGILIASVNTAMEPEFGLVTPAGVSCHYHRFVFTGGGSNEEVVKNLKRAEEFIADAAEIISQVRPSVMGMAHTGVSFIGGCGHDQVLIKKMQERNGNVPTTTASSSVIDAFNKMGIKKVSIAMPYLERVSQAQVKFVQDNGVKVVNARWLNKAGIAIPEISEETLYHLVRDVDDPESEAIFVSCTDMHTFEIIDKLECDLKKPVITSNQATIWNMLRLAGINDRIEGYGQLLSKY